jgi:catalase (peroxidase I)
MGGVRVGPLALTRAPGEGVGGPTLFGNGDANQTLEAAWGQEPAIHEKNPLLQILRPQWCLRATPANKYVVLETGKHIIGRSKTLHRRNTQCLRNA